MTDIGKAYVQIIPSAKGIGGAISKELKGESESAGKASGLSLVGALKKVVATAAIGKAIAETVKAGGALEQSLGGVETLFKGSADKVKQQAIEAYKTTGLSANAYMENVTGFSASLLQSLGGDTDKAAKISNMAMIDMADNSNKMGTAMGSIQDAYQGFAKQNYTMLDNLKLGYGGTKSEMERLLADATKLTGVKYDINNLADVYEAIHAVQEEIGITGTTAIEAEQTISGSFNAMKASFQNVLGALATGFGLKESFQGLADSLSTFLFGNLIPMIWNIATTIPSALVGLVQAFVPHLLQAGADFINFLATGITTNVPVLLAKIPEIIQSLAEFFTVQLPVFLQKGAELIGQVAMGIISAVPGAIGAVMQLMTSLFSTIAQNFPQLVENGKQMIINLSNGIIERVPTILQNIGTLLSNVLTTLAEKLPDFLKNGIDMIKNLANGILSVLGTAVSAIAKVLFSILVEIAKNLPDILSKGIEIIVKLAAGILQNMPAAVTAIASVLGNIISEIASFMGQLLQQGVDLIAQLAGGIAQSAWNAISAMGQVLNAVLNAISGFSGSMISAGYNLLMGLATGISNAVGAVVGRAVAAAQRVVSAVKGFFGIHSPSRVFAEIGEYLDAGLAEGITGNIRPVEKAMQNVSDVAQRSFESEIAMTASRSGELQDAGIVESAGGAIENIVQLLQLLLRKNSNIYIDRDKLIGEILDEVDQLLADKQNVTDMAYGGV